MRRDKPELLVATLVLILLGLYVWYTQRVVVTLRADAARSTDIYRRIFRAFGDTTLTTETLLELSKDVQAQGVPIIVTDLKGQVSAHANLPIESPDAPLANEDPRVRNYIPIL